MILTAIVGATGSHFFGESALLRIDSPLPLVVISHHEVAQVILHPRLAFVASKDTSIVYRPTTPSRKAIDIS